MGVVVAARHVELDEQVAIKFLLPAFASEPEVVARFLREGKAAVKIRSEHVVRVSDVGRLDGGAPYMVMEYLEGCDLGELVRRHVRGARRGARSWDRSSRSQAAEPLKKNEETGTFAWAAAKTACVSPWRLPTAFELMTLVDDARATVPVIDTTFFPTATNVNFWSSSPDAMASTKAWNVDFDTGANYNADVTTVCRVRCVR